MTEEIAKKVSELYKKKSTLSDCISQIINNTTDIRGLSYYSRSCMFYSGTITLDFIPEIKEFCLTKLKLQLHEVELELNNISCK